MTWRIRSTDPDSVFDVPLDYFATKPRFTPGIDPTSATQEPCEVYEVETGKTSVRWQIQTGPGRRGVVAGLPAEKRGGEEPEEETPDANQ